jgi:hypothetical protein
MDRCADSSVGVTVTGSLSIMSLTALTVSGWVLVAEESAEKSEPLIHPYLVGGGALGILLLALVALLAFGAGREHS